MALRSVGCVILRGGTNLSRRPCFHTRQRKDNADSLHDPSDLVKNLSNLHLAARFLFRAEDLLPDLRNRDLLQSGEEKHVNIPPDELNTITGRGLGGETVKEVSDLDELRFEAFELLSDG